MFTSFRSSALNNLTLGIIDDHFLNSTVSFSQLFNRFFITSYYVNNIL